MNPRAAQERYAGVQVLRFVAALLVVVCHSTLIVSERMPYLGFPVWQKGGIGVSLFFVISGFVIVLSSRSLEPRADGWALFAWRRLVRIVPLYWIATTLKLLTVSLEPALTLHSGLNWTHVLCSYLFLPARNPLGEITPLHAVGWTLNYEMFFYAAFAFALYCRLRVTPFIAILFGSLVLWGLINPEFSRSWPVLIYTSPLVLLFLCGMLLAQAALRAVPVPPWLGLAAILLGAGLIGHFDVLPGWPSFFYQLAAVFIVAGVVFIEPWLKRMVLAVPILLGESSYALYLFHPFLLTACGLALARAHWSDPISAVACMSALAVAASLAIHVGLEAPLTAALKRRARSHQSALSSQPSLS
jgi:peptidoglycan/LPS O-acetylase OafA/YrhL